MYIALMIPMDKAAMADGLLWPMAWSTDGGGIFGTSFPELDDGIPRFPEDAAARAQEEIEGFFAVHHERMVLETRSEAIIKRVQVLVRTRKDLQAAVYLVRDNEQGIEEERFDILPDGSFHPPLDLKTTTSNKDKSGKLPPFEEPPVDEPDWDPFEEEEEEEGREISFTLGRLNPHGELDLSLEVNGVKGSALLSKKVWERMGEVAGWKTAPTGSATEAGAA